ncbi:MAG: serine/threonine protein kinase [Planctomyces sp.]|nr:serine/threonine protein kinase [Planctomyces sp.]
MPADSTYDPTVLSLDHGGKSWSLLSQTLDRFVDAWEAALQGLAAAPELAGFLPDQGTPPLQLELLAELVKVDLEYRWTHNRLPRRVEDYLAEFPQLEPVVTTDLLFEECLLRRQAGDDVDLREYRDRFPRAADALARLLGDSASRTESRRVPQAREIRRQLEQFQPGDALDDFDLLTLLGAGAFARVFLARQRSMQRLVALKLSADHSREPQTLAQLDHDHIVRVFDQRIIPQQGLRLLYMQYVPGGTLQAVVAKVRETVPAERTETLLLAAVREALASRGEQDRLPAGWTDLAPGVPWADCVCRIGVRLARALDYAHRKGVLHRDIKPANVLLAGDGAPRLADFNISFAAEVSGSAPAAYFGGSLAYMSPEQLEACHPDFPRQADSLDGRSDLYSVATVLWELLHGDRPFRDERVAENWNATVAAMIARRQSDRPAPPADSLPPGGAPLQHVLETCLAADPEVRFANGEELARRLELCLDPRGWELLHGNGRPLKRLIARAPVLAAIAGVLVWNIVAALFNLWYNHREIIQRLPGSEPHFWRIQSTINAVAFPLGLAWALACMRGVFPAVKRGRSADRPVRRRALLGGVYAGGVCLTLWIVAGFAYPLVLRQLSGDVPFSVHVHFLVSLTLCGLVAAVYPFFTLSWLGTRVYYPRLLDLSDPSRAEDAVELRSLRQWSEAALMLAAAVPLLAVTVLTTTGSEARPALIAAAAGGLAGFVGAFAVFRELREDIAALLRVVRDDASRPR